MDLAARLRTIVDPLPEGAAVTLPVEVLRAWLAGDEGEERLGDYTVEEVGRFLTKAPSTIRTMIGDGRLRAYRLGREWRVTADAIRELRDRSHHTLVPASRRAADLGSWRRHFPKAERR